MSIVIAACGRIRFDPLSTGDANGDGATGDGGPMLSCVSLPPTCGPSGTSSCCDTALVPGGTFDRSYDHGTDGMYPDTSNPATVSAFRLDTYEVTVGRFRQFVTAGMGTQASPPATGAGARTLNGIPSQGGWDASWTSNLTANSVALVAALTCNGSRSSWTSAASANESLPINCISWFEAFAFCVWDGGYLPTEAEWNYAASGGSEQRAYPWSNPASSLTVDCSYANYAPGGTSFCVNPPSGAPNAVGSESPKGDGKWGQADLGGNVAEWAFDGQGNYANPCVDCADLTDSMLRALRGGVFSDDATFLRGARRGLDTPSLRDSNFGVRCARAP
jgi:formylglycine-generating enzyme required for sulfatase activity